MASGDAGAPGAPTTRQRLLDAGRSLLEEEPVGNAFSHVKAATVARRAGMTHGAFFHQWPTQAEFLEELLDYTLEHDRVHTEADPLAEGLRRLDAGEDLEAMVRWVCDREAQVLEGNPSFAVRMALWGKQGGDPAIRRRLAAQYRSSDERYGAAYTEVLGRTGRRFRPPYTGERVATVVRALLEGLVLRRAVDPDAVPAELFGRLFLAILPEFVEDGGDDPLWQPEGEEWPRPAGSSLDERVARLSDQARQALLDVLAALESGPTAAPVDVRSDGSGRPPPP